MKESGFSLIEVMISMTVMAASMAAFMTYMNHQQKGLNNLITRNAIENLHREVADHFNVPGVCGKNFEDRIMEPDVEHDISSAGILNVDGSIKYETVDTDPSVTYVNHSLKFFAVKLGEWTSANPGDLGMRTGTAALTITYERTRDGFGNEFIVRESNIYARVKSADPADTDDYLKLDDCQFVAPEDGTRQGWDGHQWQLFVNQQRLPSTVQYDNDDKITSGPRVPSEWTSATSLSENIYVNDTERTIRVRVESVGYCKINTAGSYPPGVPIPGTAICNPQIQIKMADSSYVNVASDYKAQPCEFGADGLKPIVVCLADAEIPPDQEYFVTRQFFRSSPGGANFELLQRWAELRP